MALKDCFGGYGGDASTYWNVPAGTITQVTGRDGAPSLAWAHTSGLPLHIFPSATTHFFFGIALTAATIDSLPRASFTMCGDNGVTQHLTVGFNSTGVTLWRGGTGGTVLGTYAMPVASAQWVHLQLEGTIADSGGTAIVRVNGVERINFTGDTKNGGTNNSVDAVATGSGGYQNWYADMWLCDDTGPSPRNTFLGDARFRPLRPTAAGNYTQFTPDSGANYSRVNEVPISAANYVSSSTSGHKDSYTMSDAAATHDVMGLRTVALAKNPDGGWPSVRNLLRIGSTDYVGAARSLTPVDEAVYTLYADSPATSARWTVAGVNAVEVGVERI